MPRTSSRDRSPSPWLDEPAWTEARAERPPSHSDVLVVGGGILGLATAYALAGRSSSVTLIEARRIGSGASGRNAGLMLAGASDRESPHHLLSVLAAEQIDAEYERTGHLALAASPQILERMREEIARRSPDAPPIAVLDRGECEELLRTRIAARLLGGRWYAGGAVVHPGRLLRGLASAAARRGVEIAEMTRARAIQPIGRNGAIDVETSRGRVRARHVVVAAGAAAARLIPALSQAFKPVRGQMLATLPTRRVFRPAMAIDWGTVYWRQTTEGSIVLGGCTHVDPDAERTAVERVNPRIQAALEGVLPELFPDLPPLQVARRWAGIMDQTADGWPMVGSWPPGSTLWVVAGFGGHGLPPAIGVGRAVATAILDGRWDLPEAFDPGRLASEPGAGRKTMEGTVTR